MSYVAYASLDYHCRGTHCLKQKIVETLAVTSFTSRRTLPLPSESTPED